MHHIKRTKSRPATKAILAGALLVGCLALAACGSSGSSTTTSANAAATAAAGGGTGATGPRAGRFSALRECLQKNGITLPKRTPGQRPPGAGGGFFGGGAGAQLPNGVTRAQMQAALKKCGAGAGAGLRRFNSPANKQAYTKFASCMRENGVNLPAPNTSGSGPIFDTKGVNVNSTQFRNARLKCASDLGPLFRGGGSGGGPPGAPGGGGAPPGGASAG